MNQDLAHRCNENLKKKEKEECNVEILLSYVEE